MGKKSIEQYKKEFIQKIAIVVWAMKRDLEYAKDYEAYWKSRLEFTDYVNKRGEFLEENWEHDIKLKKLYLAYHRIEQKYPFKMKVAPTCGVSLQELLEYKSPLSVIWWESKGVISKGITLNMVVEHLERDQWADMLISSPVPDEVSGKRVALQASFSGP